MGEVFRFGCPECGRPFTAGEQIRGMKVSCPDCKKIFTADEAAPMTVQPNESLDDAYQRFLEELRVGEGDLRAVRGLNEHSRCRDFARFIVNHAQEGASTIYAIGTRAWDPKQEQQVVGEVLSMWDAFLRKGEGFPLIRILCVGRVAPMMSYLFSNEEPGIFESLCMLKFPAPYAIEPQQAREIAEGTQSILMQYWDVDIQGPDDAGTIERFVLETIRPGVEAHPEYSPRHTLLGLGCVVGQLVCRHPEMDARWIGDEDVPFQLGLEVWLNNSSRRQTSDPIGTVCMLMEEGRKNTLAEYLTVMPEVLDELLPRGRKRKRRLP